ncbi:MAG: regulatory protein RecX, partial [Bacilli bacterium]
MQSEKSGKEILKVRYGKQKITIVFIDGELKISPNTYTDFRLFPGKILSMQEIAELTDHNSMDKLLRGALASVSKGHPTEKMMREKLQTKGATAKQIEKIIHVLSEGGLLDDAQFVKDYLDYAKNRGYGKHRILEGLNEKGVPGYLINQISFSEESESKRALDILPALEEKFSRYNYAQRKKRIYEALMRLGYTSEVTLHTLNRL